MARGKETSDQLRKHHSDLSELQRKAIRLGIPQKVEGNSNQTSEKEKVHAKPRSAFRPLKVQK